MNITLEFYESLYKSFKENLEKVSKDPSMKNIHQFRVSIKKLKAMLTFIQYMSKNEIKKIDYFKPLTKFFKHAGYIREGQINKKLITDYQEAVTGKYIYYLEDRIDKNIRKFKKDIKLFDFDAFRIQHKSLKSFLEKVEDEMVLTELGYFAHQKLCQVKKLEREFSNNKKLHKARSHLKMLREVYRLSVRIKKDEKANNFIEQLKVLTDSIGLWHDRDVMLQSLHVYIRKRQTDDLLELYHSIDQENERMKKEAIKEIKSSVCVRLIASESE